MTWQMTKIVSARPIASAYYPPRPIPPLSVTVYAHNMRFSAHTYLRAGLQIKFGVSYVYINLLFVLE